MHFEGGGDGFTDGLEAKDIRQDFKISVQQLKGWGGEPQGNMHLERKGVNQEFGAHQVLDVPLERPRGGGEQADGRAGLE